MPGWRFTRKVTSVDKSVSIGVIRISDIIQEKVRDKRTWDIEKGILEACRNFGPGEKGNAKGISISHMGDLAITGSDMSILLLSGGMKEHWDVGVSEENESIYLSSEITKEKW